MFNRFINFRILNALLLILLLSSCAQVAPEPENRPATVQRPHNQHARVLDVLVPRKDFVAASRNVEQIRRLRMIEVIASEETGRSAFPEYRLFNVLPQSVYALLGLMDGDVLIAANDYALNDPERFRKYVQVLHLEAGETFVEIRRGGEELILKFSFIS